MVDEYAESLGVDPSMVRGDAEVKELIAAEQQAMVQAQAMAAAEQGANIAKTASETEMSEDNALGAAMQRAGLG
jgi:hypothetical protein